MRNWLEDDPSVLNMDGVDWLQAEPHRWWRRCRTQTMGYGVERCSCGAIRRLGDVFWMERKWYFRKPKQNKWGFWR